MKTNLGEFLAEVDQHLLLRAFLHGHQLTAVDVVVISNIRSTEEWKTVGKKVCQWFHAIVKITRVSWDAIQERYRKAEANYSQKVQ